MGRRSPSRSGKFSATLAPGHFLRALQSLVNTRDVEAGTDELASPQALAGWLAEHKLLTADTELDEDAWRQALEIREALRAQFRVHTGAPAEAEPLATLSHALGKARPRLHMTRKGRFVLEAAEPGWDGVLARFLITIFEAVREGEWKRLKACRSDSCQWIFYDASSNRTGRWCTVRRCGNRLNTSSYRRRRRAGVDIDMRKASRSI